MRKPKQATVIHLVPYDGIGGVEEAARSLGSFETEAYQFDLRFIFPKVFSASERSKTNRLFSLFDCGKSIAKSRPDILIVSLWRSALVGIIAKCLCSEIKLVLFIHNTRDSHWADWIVTRLALILCSEIWGDSESSIHARLQRTARKRTRTISFSIRSVAPLPEPPLSPTFAFFGRFSKQKNLPRALRIFAQVRATNPRAQLLLIGPEGDDSHNIQSTIDKLQIADSVKIHPPCSFEEIRSLLKKNNVCFFLQTSRYEGMCLAAVEAMQLGLVPVITPVGEIKNYASSLNSILVDATNDRIDRHVATDISLLLRNEHAWLTKRREAMHTWRDRVSYGQSIRTAIADLL